MSQSVSDKGSQLIGPVRSKYTKIIIRNKTIVSPNNCFGVLQNLAGRVQNQMADAILRNLQDVTAIFLTF